MENRAYEDEPNKSAYLYNNDHRQHHHPQFSLDSRYHQHSNSIEHASYHHQNQFLHSHGFDPYCNNVEMIQHGSDCHVYEDIVSPYSLALEPGCNGGGGGFHRNLTLPLRRASQSCESIDGISSSVRVTNRERTRGSVIDRLTRDNRNR